MTKRKMQLEGLAALGSRLRELRLAAGISQMKLAEMLGLNPTHGYKYILRLEKGLVPNPTLRTITAYLNACNAGWRDIADVIAEIRLGTEEAETPKPEAGHKTGTAQTEPVIITTAPSARPELVANLTAEKFWQLVQQTLDRARSHLMTQDISTANWHTIFTYIRSVCRLITSSTPETLDGQLENLNRLTSRQGLEPELLRQLLQICLEVFKTAR